MKRLSAVLVSLLPLRLAVVVSMFLIAACQKGAPAESPEVSALRARVATLESETEKARVAVLERIVALENESQKARAALLVLGAPARTPASPKAAFELVVTWPSKPGGDYHHIYDDQRRCEAARQAVFDENNRREIENQARVGTKGSVTVVAVGPVEKASAVCIPA